MTLVYPITLTENNYCEASSSEYKQHYAGFNLITNYSKWNNNFNENET